MLGHLFTNSANAETVKPVNTRATVLLHSLKTAYCNNIVAIGSRIRSWHNVPPTSDPVRLSVE